MPRVKTTEQIQRDKQKRVFLALMQIHGWNQKQVAKIIGIGESTMSRRISGDFYMTTYELLKLRKAGLTDDEANRIIRGEL